MKKKKDEEYKYYEQTNLTKGQLQNLEEDGFFDDVRAEKDRLGAEIYFED